MIAKIKNQDTVEINEIFVSDIENSIRMIDSSIDHLASKVNRLSSCIEGHHSIEHFIEQLETIELKIESLKNNQFDSPSEALERSITIAHSNNEETLRTAIVNLMILTLQHWTQHAQKDKYELAEKSKQWAVYMSNGRINTRTMDKYLNINTLPKFPRINNVLKTAYYVLNICDEENESRKKLEDTVHYVQNLVNNKALSKG